MAYDVNELGDCGITQLVYLAGQRPCVKTAADIAFRFVRLPLYVYRTDMHFSGRVAQKVVRNKQCRFFVHFFILKMCVEVFTCRTINFKISKIYFETILIRI